MRAVTGGWWWVRSRCCLPRAARVALRATFGRLPRAAFRTGGRQTAYGRVLTAALRYDTEGGVLSL